MIEIYEKKNIKNYAMQMDAEKQLTVYNQEGSITQAVYLHNCFT